MAAPMLMAERGRFGPALLIFHSVIAGPRPDYRRGRRRMRRRAFKSVRTATRNFDLELAIATPPIACPSM
jgi:hypothetical protein